MWTWFTNLGLQSLGPNEMHSSVFPQVDWGLNNIQQKDIFKTLIHFQNVQLLSHTFVYNHPEEFLWVFDEKSHAAV